MIILRTNHITRYIDMSDWLQQPHGTPSPTFLPTGRHRGEVPSVFSRQQNYDISKKPSPAGPEPSMVWYMRTHDHSNVCIHDNIMRKWWTLNWPFWDSSYRRFFGRIYTWSPTGRTKKTWSSYMWNTPETGQCKCHLFLVIGKYI